MAFAHNGSSQEAAFSRPWDIELYPDLMSETGDALYNRPRVTLGVIDSGAYSIERVADGGRREASGDMNGGGACGTAEDHRKEHLE